MLEDDDEFGVSFEKFVIQSMKKIEEVIPKFLVDLNFWKSAKL